MTEELNSVALNDEDLEAVNGGLFAKGELLHNKALAEIGQKLGEMGGLLKKTFFGDHLVHYDD